MKILIVNLYYYPNMIGGTETSIKLLADYLKKNGYDVAVYCLAGNGKTGIDFVSGIKIYRGTVNYYKSPHLTCLSIGDKILNKLKEIDNFKIRDEYENVLNDFQPDIVHTNNLYGYSTYLWKVTKEHNIPLVHTLRDYELLAPIKLLPHLSSLIGKKRSRLVNVVTSPSYYTLKRFIDKGFFGDSKTKVIFNAVELDINVTRSYIQRLESSVNTKVNFLFVGMLEKIKGVENLLVAFHSIDNRNISLTICGQGTLAGVVDEYCQKDQRIHYLGQLNKSDLKNAFLESDVLVVPSIWEEPFGRVVIEGNQHGLPVIGSNRGGVKEIIDNIHTGELFQYDSVDDLKSKIIKFSDRAYIKNFYNNIINGIEKYSIEKQVKEFEDIYAETRTIKDNSLH